MGTLSVGLQTAFVLFLVFFFACWKHVFAEMFKGFWRPATYWVSGGTYLAPYVGSAWTGRKKTNIWCDFLFFFLKNWKLMFGMYVYSSPSRCSQLAPSTSPSTLICLADSAQEKHPHSMVLLLCFTFEIWPKVNTKAPSTCFLKPPRCFVAKNKMSLFHQLLSIRQSLNLNFGGQKYI